MGDRVDAAATDAEALLRAVCAAPGDDTPRLGKAFKSRGKCI